MASKKQKRYFAKEVNGKGYLCDRKFGNARVPIAVETTYDFACKQAQKFNEEEKEERFAPKAKAKSAAKSKPAAKCKSAAIKPTAPKITSKPTVKSKHAVTKPAAKKRTTFTVMDGQRGKTFATMKEAQAYEADMRARTGVFCEIRKGNKKISHRVVSFTARNK